MGNLPLFVNKKDELHFSYSIDGTKDHLSLSTYLPYNRSIENLHPLLSYGGSMRMQRRKEEVVNTVMGMEMDQELVCSYGMEL